ncbi:Aminodeoxychorismate lyase [hydrothermal vent metagenome]|uniref:aminodeoxychorismate lyase n=1 Tax=hydrothermal vent metagenome TaxID=652676 RepID=A0A3B0X9P4_9ZZZZ
MKILVNGVENTCIDVRDRGFQYGDGLFETIAYKNNALQLWDEHMLRFQQGCERLSLPAVDERLWQVDIKKLQLQEDAVIKLSISRGVAGRGYAYNETDNLADNVTRVTAAYAWPNYTEAQVRDRLLGVTAIICKTPISVNPLLAGIKHLNRLDNVLARNEWHSSDIAEGFMLDNNQHVIEGTMSNVFCVLGEEIYTPLLQYCGVQGVMRQRVISQAREMGISVNVIEISKLNFLQMDALFVTSSLIGLWPVKKVIDDGVVTDFAMSGLVTDLQAGVCARALK